MRERLPEAEVVVVDSLRRLLREGDPEFDGLLYSAESGSAWTLIYPSYSVVVPEPGRVNVPLAYAMPLGDASLASFVDTWVHLKGKDGTIAALFEHWILGRAAEDEAPRWSVLRDVLGWGSPRAESDAGPTAPPES